MRVVMPGKGILEPLAQAGIKPLEGKAGRDVFGFAAARRDDARRKDRCQRRHTLERGIRMPELVGLAAQGKPVICGHHLSVRSDGRENHKMRAGALRADLGHFRRPEAARKGKLKFVGHLLVAKDQYGMLPRRQRAPPHRRYRPRRRPQASNRVVRRQIPDPMG